MKNLDDDLVLTATAQHNWEALSRLSEAEELLFEANPGSIFALTGKHVALSNTLMKNLSRLQANDKARHKQQELAAITDFAEKLGEFRPGSGQDAGLMLVAIETQSTPRQLNNCQPEECYETRSLRDSLSVRSLLEELIASNKLDTPEPYGQQLEPSAVDPSSNLSSTPRDAVSTGGSADAAVGAVTQVSL